MYYSFTLRNFPVITRTYSVTRKTIWEIAEKENLLIFIKEGPCSITSENETAILAPGDVYFVPANQSYIRKPVDDTLCTMQYIHFVCQGDVTQEEYEDLYHKIEQEKQSLDHQILSGEAYCSYASTIYLQSLNRLTEPEKLDLALKNINLFSSSRQMTCNFHSAIYLCSILLTMSQYTIEQVLFDSNMKPVQVIPKNLKKAIGYIVTNYTRPISLDELASHCNISKQQLIRYFKSAFQKTPVEYITEFKLSRAKELLFYSPELSIKEISEELGFDNQHYFSRIFSKYNKESPSAYRNRTLNFKD